jgi:membrane protease YdiL (CAAX protease family)
MLKLLSLPDLINCKSTNNYPMMPEYRSKPRQPFMSLLNLLFLIVLGMTVFTLTSIFICYLLYGSSVLKGLQSGALEIGPLKIIQLFSSVGTFIFPALLFVRQESNNSFSYLKLNTKIDLRLIALAVIILYAFTPFIEWAILMNQSMKLPAFLHSVEDWMRNKEMELAVLTKQFLVMKSPVDLGINLLIIAVIPGVGEELLFRGCLQKVFIKWTNNHHYGIWIAAIIFSAIHVQFYGFVPRMVLGALFGYLFYWSQNLLVPMIAHFINNGTAVVTAYLVQKRGEPIDMIDKQSSFSGYIVLLSLVFTMILLLSFYKFSKVKTGFDE